MRTYVKSAKMHLSTLERYHFDLHPILLEFRGFWFSLHMLPPFLNTFCTIHILYLHIFLKLIYKKQNLLWKLLLD